MPTLEVKRTNPVLVGGAGLLIIVALVFGIRSLTRERVQVRIAHASFQNLLRQGNNDFVMANGMPSG